jgi:hypothetical protein
MGATTPPPHDKSSGYGYSLKVLNAYIRLYPFVVG